MRHTGKIIRKKPGISPGSLVYTGGNIREKVNLQLVRFTEDTESFFEALSVDSLFENLDKNQVNWIHVNGLHDTLIIEAIGKQFDIHPLVLEDVLHIDHMPKLAIYDDYIFLTFKMMSSGVDNELGKEHLSMILGPWFLITFQETRGDVFDHIREGIRSGHGRLRKRGADYLFYRLLDTVVDHYFVLTDKLEDDLEGIEELLLKQRLEGVSNLILERKKDMIFLKRNILPLREEFRKIRQEDSALIAPGTHRFLDDVYDHLTQMGQTLDGCRDLITSLLELQMAANANRMNNVMKTLTVFAAIFMPLTFIAGVYGMNFMHMPELAYSWAYPAVLVLMAGVAVAMLIYMKRRKWF